MNDLISRQAAIDAQQESTRKFVELVVEYPDPELCAYKEYKGKPYYSIKYIENGETYVGYGTYSPEVLSQYLKEYFMPSAQPEPQWISCSGRLPEKAGWYLCTYKDGRVNTKYWSADKGWVDNIRLHMFELYDIRSRLTKEEVKLAGESIYWNDWVKAWMPLPEPYQGRGCNNG